MTTPTLPTDTILLSTMLVEAQKQYHALTTGMAARVVVDQNGERVEFTPANSTKLYNYIGQLQAALNPGTAPRAAGPLQFFF